MWGFKRYDHQQILFNISVLEQLGVPISQLPVIWNISRLQYQRRKSRNIRRTNSNRQDVTRNTKWKYKKLQNKDPTKNIRSQNPAVNNYRLLRLGFAIVRKSIYSVYGCTKNIEFGLDFSSLNVTKSNNLLTRCRRHDSNSK